MPRIVKAPAVRKAELVDVAQRLFLKKGYERTTVNDVIEAAGLSKGAFYHHFSSKEDLLEAIAARFARQALEHAEGVRGARSLNAVQRLNLLLAVSREWKAENVRPLSQMFAVLLRPENATLYHRIVGAVFAAFAPALAAIISDGEREGTFDVGDAELAAEALLWLGEGRRAVVVEALRLAESVDVDAAAAMILKRLRAEEALADRLLGLKPGSVDFAGSEAYLKSVLGAWIAEAQPATVDASSDGHRAELGGGTV